MSVDQSARLVEHARLRHERTLQQAHTALTDLANTGQAITISSLANHARVSRSWIYTQLELRTRIEQLQQHQPNPAPPRRDNDSAASDESLRRRLTLAHQRITQLRTENQQLRHDLARAHGQLRQALQGPPR